MYDVDWGEIIQSTLAFARSPGRHILPPAEVINNYLAMV